jgi:hypothetical protein
VAPRLPSDALVRLGILILQTDPSLYQPPTSAHSAYAGIYAGARAPVKTFSPERSMAQYTTPPLHGRFPFLADSYHDALLLRQRVEALLSTLGLQRNPKKGVWTPTQVGEHLGLTVDLQLGMLQPAKLQQLAQHASSLLGRAASNARWLSTRQLAAFAGKAHFLYLAIAPARFFLRELHNVLATRAGWGERVRLTHQLRRDLEW